MQYTWQLALVLVPVYSIKHSVSCYIYYQTRWATPIYSRTNFTVPECLFLLGVVSH